MSSHLLIVLFVDFLIQAMHNPIYYSYKQITMIDSNAIIMKKTVTCVIPLNTMTYKGR